MTEFNELQNEKQRQWDEYTARFKKLEKDCLDGALQREKLTGKLQRGEISKKKFDEEFYKLPENTIRIDQGLEPVLIGLWANGMETSYSCFGHVNKDESRQWLKKQGLPGSKVILPSISLSIDSPNKKMKTDELHRKLDSFIEEFYKNQAVPENNIARLISVQGDLGFGVALEVMARSVSEEKFLNLSDEQQVTLLEEAQEQLRKFAEFLKIKFFNS